MIDRIRHEYAAAQRRALNIRNRKSRKQSGFTLMELLVVIVILGFLIGMLAPRLASIIDDQVIDNVCDSNNKGARQYLKIMWDKTGKLPNKVTNLVIRTGAGTYALPSTSDGDADNGADVFAEDFVVRNGLSLHMLNAAEIMEIRKNYGITTLLNLNDTAGYQRQNGAAATLAGQAMEEVTLGQAGTATIAGAAQNLGVAMVGAGAAASADDLIINEAAVNNAQGNPYWVGRIMLGLGPQSSLVSLGYVQNAALCPGGMQNAANVTYNNYVMVLPRLAATVARLDAAGYAEGQEIAIAAAEPNASGVLTEVASGLHTSFALAAQEKWDFDASCPEGHKWPDNDHDSWVDVTP